MLKSHSEAAPESAYIGKELVKLITLDSIFKNYKNNYKKILLKIDTQGNELDVLIGAKESLAEIYGVQIELSTIQLYENQKIYNYYIDYFQNQNFQLWNIFPAFVDPKTGRVLQFDALFIKEI